jgi:hypothetical protein
LSTAITALKFKYDSSNPEKMTAVKAHIICELSPIFCYYHIEAACYFFRDVYHPRTLHKKDHIWNDLLSKDIIYNNDEFLNIFCVTRTTFPRIVALIKDNPVLQGRNSEKQSKHFVPELHMLAALKFVGAVGNQGCLMPVVKSRYGQRKHYKLC